MATATAVPPTSTSAPVRNTVAVWFEIPVTDFARAIRFYENVFAISLIHDSRFPTLAIFPYEKPGISGALVHAPGRASQYGIILYVNCDGQLDEVIERAIEAGSQVLEGKEELPGGMGWTAQIRDSEGNRIGLHSVV